MGDEHEERYAARRAAFERLIQELPPAGTAAYWQRIEQAPKEAALPPEVLVHCLRERGFMRRPGGDLSIIQGTQLIS